MKEKFLRFAKEQYLFDEHPRVLAAVSGGVDSVVLARLLHAQGWLAALVHVNYGKRGAESEADEIFVQQLAATLNVTFHTVKVNSETIQKQDGDGFQEKARNFRYAYFEAVCEEFNYPQLATGHQLDDNLETMLHRLFRGAGIHGLRGIPVKNKNIVRPLLFATREEIESVARREGWSWREDASNQEQDFQRNKIRHQLLPLLKSWNPNVYDGLSETFDHLRDAELIFNAAIEAQKKNGLILEQDCVRIRIDDLMSSIAPSTILYEWIRPYGFNATQAKQIVNGLRDSEAAFFYAEAFVLSKERHELVIVPREKEHAPMYILNRDVQLDFLQVEFSETASLAETNPYIALLDAEKLQWPLTLRVWKAGDRMRPLGMNGTKKISDILTDMKAERLNRKQLPVLLSGEELVWLPGFRIAHDFA
ncbi:MAG: tRNA lysidine(34) synthetase TilS, partial [Bacteroidia bacterium]